MNEVEPTRPTATLPRPGNAGELGGGTVTPRRPGVVYRVARPLAGSAVAHLPLLLGTAVFLFPFLWMLSTSLKTDEELPAAAVFPAIPHFRAISPYVRPIEPPERPSDVPADRWEAVLPGLFQLAESRLLQLQLEPGQAAAVADGEAHRRAAARWLVNRVVAKMNVKLWTGPDVGLFDDFERQLSAGDSSNARAALDQSLARLELLSIQLRTLSAHILTEGRDLTGAWTVESGPAHLVSGAGVRRIDYDFSAGRDPVILRYDFSVPPDLAPDQLHKLTVAVRADDSWHQITATLDWGEQHWLSQRPTYLAQHRPLSIIFQPPTFDDATFRNRTWIPISAVGPRQDAKSAPQATLRLILSPSSTLAAMAGKAQRNYLRAFLSVPFWTYVLNSVLLVGLTMGGALFSASFVAYAFARLNWPGRSVAFVILLATMMLPAQVTMIPSFMIWRTVGWYNTLNPMWVPAWFGSAFFIFLMTQHMRTIPRELEEAARIDGLNALQTWWYIILPQVKPSLAAIAIMTFMGAWNEFMGPLIYLRDQAKFPLSLGLFGMRVEQTTVDWTMLMAGNMLMTLPVIVIFFLFQRYFIQGMTMSGMKG